MASGRTTTKCTAKYAADVHEIHRYVKTCMHPVHSTIIQLPSDSKVWLVGEERRVKYEHVTSFKIEINHLEQ
jgi:hypothetical protein